MVELDLFSCTTYGRALQLVRAPAAVTLAFSVGCNIATFGSGVSLQGQRLPRLLRL
jgi:hypothetical protein